MWKLYIKSSSLEVDLRTVSTNSNSVSSVYCM